ncbi:MAG: hypothetical protein E7566_00530 [Ruminococcaceae bacterium]|nr:hypothetical protein [Oscillospiraceae bacterium]
MKTKSIISLFLCLILLISSVSFGTSAKEEEVAETGNYTYYIENYEQLRNLAKTSQSDCRYILSTDIEQVDNLNDLEVIIPSGSIFNLDLNGYSIKRSTSGNDLTLFRIKSDGVMTIKDTSASQTGYCAFSEGYGNHNKSVFLNEGGELEIFNGYYEIFSPYEQGDCCVVRTSSGYTNIYDGTFDSSSSNGGDTIKANHDAYLYDTPHVTIFGGDFYGKYQSIDASAFGNYLNYAKDYPNGALHPAVYVLGGNFYITNGGKDGKDASFAYCNNGWGRVIVAEGTVLYKCLNSGDQRFLNGVSKKLFTETIDDYTGGYYEVTAPPLIISEGLDYYYRLIGLCQKAEVNSYGESIYNVLKEQFDYINNQIDTIYVPAEEKISPEIKLVNRTIDHQYINWYICNEFSYNGEDTQWTHLGDYQNVSQWQFDDRPEEGGNYLIRCVVTNSDLTTYEDIVRLVYEPLKSDTIVSSVEVNDVTIPACGEKVDFTLAPADDSFYINAVYWTDVTDSKNRVYLKENDTFEAGHKYELEVWIRANEYYKFQTDSDGWLEISAVVGGKEAEVILPGSSISAELLVTFAVEENEIPTQSSSSENTTPSNLTTPSSPSYPSGSDNPNPKGILGDADCSGKVNVKDATAIQKHTASLITLSETGLILADVDANTNVNVKDATAIQKWIAGIPTSFPIGEAV